MKKRKHSLLIIVLTAAIALSSAACAGEAGSVAESTITVPGNGKWVDSSIRGTITAESEPRLQDDFAAAANKEYLLELAASTDEDTAAGSDHQLRLRPHLRHERAEPPLRAGGDPAGGAAPCGHLLHGLVRRPGAHGPPGHHSRRHGPCGRMAAAGRGARHDAPEVPISHRGGGHSRPGQRIAAGPGPGRKCGGLHRPGRLALYPDHRRGGGQGIRLGPLAAPGALSGAGCADGLRPPL